MIALDQTTITTAGNTDEAADILRCLALLYGTRAGECALDRDFGLDWSNVDKPLPVSQALIAADIVAKTQKYEPRCRVLRVEWTTDAVLGTAAAKVVIDL